MPLRGTRNPDNRRTDWLGIARTLTLQVLALLALAGAFIVYLDWSSNTALEEFVGASEPSAANPGPHSQSAASAKAVKSHVPCGPKT